MTQMGYSQKFPAALSSLEEPLVFISAWHR